MSPQQLEKIKQIFEGAVTKDIESRAAFLESACEGDGEIRGEVEQLLNADEQANGLMERPLRPAPIALSAGARLGPYQIVRVLGAGGMGEVYQARDPRLKRTVAIKTLRGYLVGSQEAHVRFEREAQAVASLSHAHICTLYDIGNEGDIDYLVMEDLEGETLAARLNRGPMSVDQVLQYAAEISDALREAHRHGIIHRDLKPSNVMLTRSGTKLLDFGIAKMFGLAGASGGQSTLTITPENGGVAIGTLAYMSPEQLRGVELDERTDLFSLGSVIYEMTTGRQAFPGTTATVIDLILNRDPAPPRLANSGLPEQLESIILRALQKDRLLRYQSAAAIHEDLVRLRKASEPKPQQTPIRKTLLFIFAATMLYALGLGAAIYLITK